MGPGEVDPQEARPPDPFQRQDAPVLSLTLWPNRPLSRGGFAAVLILIAAGLSLPLLSVLGTRVAFGLLPFLIGTVIAVWIAIRASYRSGRLVEELRLWPDRIAVERREPDGQVRRWDANPYWVSLDLRDTPRIEKYLTLAGNGRVIELGAFLSPEERVRLHRDLAHALDRLRSPAGLTPS